MDANGIGKTALIANMVEPFLVSGLMEKASNALLRNTMLIFNPLGRFFHSAFHLNRKGYVQILWKKYRVNDMPDNGAVFEVVSAYPDRFMGWVYVHASAADGALSEIEKWSSNPGMVGVKAAPFWHRYSYDCLGMAAGRCVEHDAPILIHLVVGTKSGDYQRLPGKFPGLKVIYAHAGMPYYRKLRAYIKDKKDVYVDLSSPYLNQGLIRKAVDSLGPEKCLYGTDGPYGEQSAGED